MSVCWAQPLPCVARAVVDPRYCAPTRSSVIVKYPCVCCGHLTLDEPPGSHLICPVCFWEDDAVQLRWPDWAGGANKASLIEAQRNFQRLDASDKRSIPHVRAAKDDEPVDPNWRPINPRQDEFEPRGVQLTTWPDDRTVLYWWRYRDTTFWIQGPDRRGQERSRPGDG